MPRSVTNPLPALRSGTKRRIANCQNWDRKASFAAVPTIAIACYFACASAIARQKGLTAQAPPHNLWKLNQRQPELRCRHPLRLIQPRNRPARSSRRPRRHRNPQKRPNLKSLAIKPAWTVYRPWHTGPSLSTFMKALPKLPSLMPI